MANYMDADRSKTIERAWKGSPEFPDGIPDGTKFTINGEEQIYTKDGAGASQNQPDSTSKKETPPTWSGKKDARELSGAGKYPNYYSHKTRSGHVFMMDDSNGAEHVTLQHRSGTAIQFHPDGTIQMTAHNGSYEIIFGEKRMKITGAYDVAVEGAASLRVDGNYNMTVNGDMNTTVKGNMSISSKNYNQVTTGNMDVTAKNKTEKIEGSAVTQATKGAVSLVGGSGVTIASSEGSVAIGASKQVGILAGSTLMAKSTGQMSFKSSGAFVVDATGKSSLSSSDTMVINGGQNAYLQSGQLVQLASALIQVKQTPVIGGGDTDTVSSNDPVDDFKHDQPYVPEP